MLAQVPPVGQGGPVEPPAQAEAHPGQHVARVVDPEHRPAEGDQADQHPQRAGEQPTAIASRASTRRTTRASIPYVTADPNAWPLGKLKSGQIDERRANALELPLSNGVTGREASSPTAQTRARNHSRRKARSEDGNRPDDGERPPGPEVGDEAEEATDAGLIERRSW